jgi:hypothetical protein
MNVEDLEARLDDELGAISVESLGVDAYRVILPSTRQTHDSIAISLERQHDAWVISDAGQIAWLLEDEFNQVLAVLQCAGAPFDVEHGVVTHRVPADAELPAALWTFAHHMAAVPVLWHALACQRQGTEELEVAQSAPPSTVVMAREAKERIVNRLDSRYRPLLAVQHRIGTDKLTTFAPLAVVPPRSTMPPSLIASFIDTTAPKAAITSAQKTTSFLLDVASGLNIAKFVVVRGPISDVAYAERIYKHEGASTVSTENEGPFLQAAEEACRVLMPL